MIENMKEAGRRCNRCIIDDSVPGIFFDDNGICNHCKIHEMLCDIYPNDRFGEKIMDDIIKKIKQASLGKKYDCVVGISGGRDSTYTLFLAVKKWGLRPLAVHFNDGFGNPVAGENMEKATKILGVDTVTISADWRESKDIKLAFLRASTPDIEQGNDLGIAAALYGAASKFNIGYILIGQSFRTEGIAPLEWNYLDGKYLKAVHKRFGTISIRKWKADDPGFNLDVSPLFYYTVIRRIKTITPLYYENYIRDEANKIMTRDLNWVYPGTHWYDSLYQALYTYVLRVKFKIDRRIYNYSALIRSGQMDRTHALNLVQNPSIIEDRKVIDLCIKRLGIMQEEFEEYLALAPKTFRDYPNNYNLIRYCKLPIWLLCQLNLLPKVIYEKYFKFC